MAIKQVTVVSIPVSDQERAKKFYIEKLGLELLGDDSSIPGLRWILVAPKGGNVALTLVTWFESMPAGSLRGLVLVSDDIEKDYKRMQAQGVEFEEPPEQKPWGRTETVLHDPDGNCIVLQQV